MAARRCNRTVLLSFAVKQTALVLHQNLHSHIYIHTNKKRNMGPHLALQTPSPPMETRAQPVADLVLIFRPEAGHTRLELLSSQLSQQEGLLVLVGCLLVKQTRCRG